MHLSQDMEEVWSLTYHPRGHGVWKVTRGGCGWSTTHLPGNSTELGKHATTMYFPFHRFLCGIEVCSSEMHRETVAYDLLR